MDIRNYFQKKPESPGEISTINPQPSPTKLSETKLLTKKAPQKKRRIREESEDEVFEKSNIKVSPKNPNDKKSISSSRLSTRQPTRQPSPKAQEQESDNKQVTSNKRPKKLQVESKPNKPSRNVPKSDPPKSPVPDSTTVNSFDENRQDSKINFEIDEIEGEVATEEQTRGGTTPNSTTSKTVKIPKTPAVKKSSEPLKRPIKRKSDESFPPVGTSKKKQAKNELTNDEFIADEISDQKIKTVAKASRPKTPNAQKNNDNESEPKPAKAASKPSQQYFRKSKTGPSAPGSKEIPLGEDMCLAGKAFVFTGELTSISREEAQDLVKRYGGRVTGAISSRTTYVVVGDDPGPKKIEKAQELKIKTLNEDELFELIKTSVGKEAEVTPSKKGKKKSDEASLDKPEKVLPTQSHSARLSSVQSPPHTASNKQLWVEKHKPNSLKDLCGNKALVEKLQTWLREWGNPQKGHPRAVLISGPPGIGKTTAAHLVGKLEGYTINEFNASDTRSKKSLDQLVKIATQNTSITSFYHGNSIQNDENDKDKGTTEEIPLHGRTLIIMDEVDGMSSGDRGGVAELIQLIKKTQVPIICICNDRSSPKMRTLGQTCGDIRFQRPRVEQIRSRIMTIAHKENLKIGSNVVDELIKGTHTDIRQVLNMLSTYKLTENSMDYDQGKALSKASEKSDILSPWDVLSKLFNASSWVERNNVTLDDKLELYFQDPSLIPLMVQENYIKPKPQRAVSQPGNDFIEISLEMRKKAADAICDGDIIDRKIHGSQMNWSLMPLHGLISCVRPSSFIHGSMSGQSSYGGPISFPSWLGQNSKMGKYQRRLQEIQSRMRLKISGDKNEVRQSYLPALLSALTNPLIQDGTDGVPQVVELMDEYYLTKDDWDVMIEFELVRNDGETLLKKISTSTKGALTRKYNATTHPLPFTRLSTMAKVTKVSSASAEVPDVEEAIEIDDVIEEEEESGSADEDDLAHDANIKQKNVASKAKISTKKSAGAGSTRGARGGRGSRGGGARGRGKK
ncbi:hypothetical protein G9A89_019840 [Geosiphon pyriformis]|nr:hypothetical protein G9A89_019840 [Geosiphon pyriformis]